jgi:hypothetical protein
MLLARVELETSLEHPSENQFYDNDMNENIISSIEMSPMKKEELADELSKFCQNEKRILKKKNAQTTNSLSTILKQSDHLDLLLVLNGKIENDLTLHRSQGCLALALNSPDSSLSESHVQPKKITPNTYPQQS